MSGLRSLSRGIWGLAWAVRKADRAFRDKKGKRMSYSKRKKRLEAAIKQQRELRRAN